MPAVSWDNRSTHGAVIATSKIHKEDQTQKTQQSKEDISGKIQQKSDTADILPQQKTKEIHIWDQTISKLYTDDCGRFPIISISGNEYIMIAYHCDSNTILQAPFVNRKDKHRIRAYN